MAYNFKSQLEAIEAMLPALYYKIYTSVGELDMTVYTTDEPVPYSERKTGEKRSVKKGDVWAEPWGCGWFNFTGTVPECAKGSKVVLILDVHGEIGIVDKEGNIYQGLTTGTCHVPSRDFGCFGIRKREYIVSECADGGEKINIWADAGCNFITGIGSNNRPDIGKIELADICICRDNVKALFYDAFVLYDLMKAISADSARYHRIRKALFDAACVLYDYTDDEIERASEILKPEIEKRGGDPDLKITGIGHSHIDLAWLWPIRETKRKGARTFANALYYMEKYPDYKFGASQPQLFEWVKEEQPALYEKVKEKVAEGRFEVQGAMWCEPDANLPGGESFVRQILYGKSFYKKEFGVDVKILWLPDVFGYSGALPQILSKSGVPYFLTIKLGWGNRHNQHPHQTFNWRGTDGTEILAHMPPERSYSSFALPADIKNAENKYDDKAVCDEALLLFGIGDGGGGPGELQLEALSREKNLSGLSPVTQGFAVDFFDRIALRRDMYETYSGELYFEMHQGTYTSQARNKRYNRKMEKLLREAEFALVATGSEYPKDKLDKIWKEVLLYQFHDILPGSSIKRVYDESLARYKVLYDEAQDIVRTAYGNGDYAINSLSWDRCGWEKIDGKWYNLTVPAMGSVKLEGGTESIEKKTENVNVLENEMVRLVFDTDGAICSVYDKVNCKEILKAKSNRFAVYKDNGDAWDMNECYRDREPKYFRLVRCEAFTDGPLQGVRQEYEYASSRLWQTITLKEGSAATEFDTRLEWNERERMLRTAFYTTIETEEVTCDIQFGSIKRPTHNNTSLDMAKFEICAHKYADLSDSSYGVALMNDCKYGYCVKDGMLDLNLIRNTTYPDPDADIAMHEFKYALYPHSGNVKDSDVIKKSYEFNQPLYKGGEIEQLLTVSNPDIIIENIKKAEDSDALVIRMYEAKGGEAETKLSFNKPVVSAYITDLTEENKEPVDLNCIKLHKFEIITVMVEL